MEKFTTWFLRIALIIGGLFIGLFIWGINFMGDTIYPLEIQNDRTTSLIFKTYTFTRYDKKLTVDSLVLKPSEKMDIGTSHNCNKIDSSFIRFDAIEFFLDNHQSKLFKRSELVDYLTTLEKVDCTTYLIK